MLKKTFLNVLESFKNLTVNEFAESIKERERAIKEMSVIDRLRDGEDVEIKSGDRLI